MPKGQPKQYHLRAEMRRLSDALYKHSAENPEDAMGCYREARLLVKLAIDASKEAEKKGAMEGAAKALEAHQDRLRKQIEQRKTLVSVPTITATIGGTH